MNRDNAEKDFYYKTDKEVLDMYFNEMNRREQKMLLVCAEQILLGASGDVLKNIL